MQSAQTIPFEPDVPAEPVPAENREALILELSRIVGPFGRSVVEVSGELETLKRQTDANVSTIAGVVDAVESAKAAATKVSASTNTTLNATKTAHEAVDRSADKVTTAAAKSTELAKWAQSVGTRAKSLKKKVAGVDKTANEIAKIAEQINILAVNASIEAARAGAAGPGFAVIARAINELATTTQATLLDIQGNLSELSTESVSLMEEGESATANAMSVIEGAEEISAVFATVRDLIGEIDSQTEAVASDASEIDNSYQAVLTAVRDISNSSAASAASITEASTRILNVVDESENLVALSAELGGSTEDTRFIERIRATALEAGKLFEAGVANGQISEQALFDLTMTPIPGTNPAQYMAPFTKFMEQVTPALIEANMDFDEKVVFNAPAAKNGYLATNAKKVSKPQGSDPIWNAANSRNRRILDDRASLKSGNNTKPFLLQTYRRDMGDHFMIMKDVSAPVYVNGRHWGGFRMAYMF